MKNKVVLEIMYELLWFAFAGIAAYLLILPIQNKISVSFVRYLLGSLFLVFTYFRFTAFMSRSILLNSVWVKLAFFVINIPLFFLVLDQYYTFGRVFDEYNFTLPKNEFQHIFSGTELEDLMYIKKLVTFSGSVALLLIVLFEIRIVYAIFKLRQLDKYLWSDKKTSISE